MKVVKLKPVVLKNNEVFIKPPDFYHESDDFNTEKWKSCTIISVSDLKDHFTQKRLIKEKNIQEKRLDSEAEAVKNLSQWKRSFSPVSPLLRKYTFKRQLTNMSQASDNKPKLRSVSHAVTIAPSSKVINYTFYNQVVSIVASERFKKKKNEEQFMKIFQTNIEAENEIKHNILRVNSELDHYKTSIRHLEELVEKYKESIRNRVKEHEDRQRQLKNIETVEYLAMTKVKEGSIEEGKSILFKEKMRKSKRDLHKKFQDDFEELKALLANSERKLEACDFERQKLKKELKDFKEEISNLYFRILKEGKDLRTEGLKWIIKSIWAHSSYIPISTFPKFLDEDNLIFLLKLSEKDLELENLTEKIENMRKEVKSRRTNTSISSSRELYSSVKTRLRELSRSVMCSPIEVKENEVDRKNLEKNSSCYSEIGEMRERVNKINDFIKELTENEIKRTTENYKNAPGEAEKVGLYHLIKCLVGDKVREFNKYTRNQQAKTKGLFDIKH